MPDIGPGNLGRRATARDHTAEVLSFIKSLTGDIHPALDTSDGSAVSVVDLDPSSGQLVFDHPRSITETQPVAQSVPADSDDSNNVEHDADLLRPIAADDLQATYARCRETSNSLNQQMKKYQLESGHKHTDLDRPHGYEEVDCALAEFVETLRSEEAEYKTGALRGFLGGIRRGFRVFSSHSSNLKVFVGLIPSQESYLSILCGGLTLLCTVGKRMADIRDALSEFLSELVAIVENKGKIMEIFSENLDLHARNAELCASIMHVIHEFVDWLRTRPGVKVLKAALRPTDYKRQIFDKIRTMRQSAKDFTDMAYICGLRDGRAARKALARLEQGQLKRQEQKTILKLVFISCKSDPARTDADRPARTGRPRRPKPDAPAPYRPETLLQTYAHDPGLIDDDRLALLELRYTLPKAEQARTVALLNDERFQALTADLAPTRLLVHGCAQHTAADESATSFVVARLFDAVADAAGDGPAGAGGAAAHIVPLAFFCRRHTAWTDPNAHAPGMLLTLLLELIDQCARRRWRGRRGRSAAASASASASMQREVRELNPADVESIAALLRRVVRTQLPHGTVLFVVVDGIDAYEDDERRAETVAAVRHLLELGEDGGEGGVVLKLLVTAPGVTLWVWSLFEEAAVKGAEVLELPSVCPERDGFAALGWDDAPAWG